MPDQEKEILPGQGNPALDQEQLEQRSVQGAPFLPFIGHVRVQWTGSKGVTVSRLSSSNESSAELEGVVQQEFSRRPAFELESKFDLCSCNIVISKGFSGRAQSDPVNAISSSLEKAIDNFRDHRFDAEIQNAHRHGQWSISFPGEFDLTFVSCHHQSVDIRQQYKEAQKAREEIDAQRDEWLHTQAEPVLDAMEEQLLDTSLPSGFRDELTELREILRKDAYGFSKIIATSEVEEMLGLSATRARELSQEGRIGVPVSRFYIHSSEEAEHFAEKDRPTGKHRKN